MSNIDLCRKIRKIITRDSVVNLPNYNSIRIYNVSHKTGKSHKFATADEIFVAYKDEIDPWHTTSNTAKHKPYAYFFEYNVPVSNSITIEDNTSVIAAKRTELPCDMKSTMSIYDICISFHSICVAVFMQWIFSSHRLYSPIFVFVRVFCPALQQPGFNDATIKAMGIICRYLTHPQIIKK